MMDGVAHPSFYNHLNFNMKKVGDRKNYLGSGLIEIAHVLKNQYEVIPSGTLVGDPVDPLDDLKRKLAEEREQEREASPDIGVEKFISPSKTKMEQ